MAGMTVHPVKTTKQGAFDMALLKEQVDRCKDTLGAIMITYPSTFGVFDDDLLEIVELVHRAGGQVYLDGANMNAQVGEQYPTCTYFRLTFEPHLPNWLAPHNYGILEAWVKS